MIAKVAVEARASFELHEVIASDVGLSYELDRDTAHDDEQRDDDAERHEELGSDGRWNSRHHADEDAQGLGSFGSSVSPLPGVKLAAEGRSEPFAAVTLRHRRHRRRASHTGDVLALWAVPRFAHVVAGVPALLHDRSADVTREAAALHDPHALRSVEAETRASRATV